MFWYFLQRYACFGGFGGFTDVSVFFHNELSRDEVGGFDALDVKNKINAIEDGSGYFPSIVGNLSWSTVAFMGWVVEVAARTGGSWWRLV